MRLACSGLFIVVGVLAEIILLHRIYPNLDPYEGKLMAPTIVVLVAAAYFLFNKRSPWVKRDGIMTYRRQDELISDIYHARRVLELRDLDSNDGWYLIELDTGNVLCLWDNLPSGPLGFDSRNPEVRRFPFTEFTVLRHTTKNFTAEVDCAGQKIKPTTVALPDHYDDWLYTYVPKDGDVIPNKTFDAVQADVHKACSRTGIGEISRPAW
jgi:hypothetical protein